MRLTPKQMILIGAGLLILGVVLPFLMVMDVLESTFFINFFSYACQVSGLVLGMIGAFSAVKINQNKR
jgi:hypothetical protein